MVPYFDMNPSYGPIFKMRRVGYKGKNYEFESGSEGRHTCGKQPALGR